MQTDEIKNVKPLLKQHGISGCTIGMAKDFLRLISVFLLLVIAIMIVLPINRYWAFVGTSFMIIAFVLQLFWNKYFKPLFKDEDV